MSNYTIGEKIAAFRRIHNLTIRELSEETGLSSALLSQLERGLGNPTLFALSALANTLGISVSQLLEKPISNESLILRKKDRPHVYSASGQLLYHIASQSLQSQLELQYLELPPYQKTEGGLSVHKNEEEVLLVLKGSAIVHFEGEAFLLEEGDTIRILPNRGHQVENPVETPLQVLFARYRQI